MEKKNEWLVEIDFMPGSSEGDFFSEKPQLSRAANFHTTSNSDRINQQKEEASSNSIYSIFCC